jgi:hypothetical protein
MLNLHHEEPAPNTINISHAKSVTLKECVHGQRLGI